MQLNERSTIPDKISSKATAQAVDSHRLDIEHERGISMTGVSAVPIFTDKAITVKLLCGETLNITGQGLTVKNLDLDGGKFSAQGRVYTVKYSQAPTGIWKKLFR